MLGFPRVEPVGPGCPDAEAAGGASWSLPPPSGAVGPVVFPPPLPGCWGGGQSSLSPPSSPATCFGGRNDSAQSAERSPPNLEPVRGSGLPGSRELET